MNSSGPTPGQWADADRAMTAVHASWNALRATPGRTQAQHLSASLKSAQNAVRALWGRPASTCCPAHPNGAVDPAPGSGEGPCLTCNTAARRASISTQRPAGQCDSQQETRTGGV